MNFDENFQFGIFELLLIDGEFAEKCFIYLKPEYFKNEYIANYFLIIKKLYETYNTVPTKNQIANELLKIQDPKKYEIYNKIFQAVLTPKVSKDYLYIRDNLEKFVKKCVTYKIHNEIYNNQSQDPDFIFDRMSVAIEDFNEINFSKVKTQKFSNIEYILEKSGQSALNLIPTYFPTIDQELGGGVPRGTLTTGLSGTNVGKSIWLINWAYHLIKNGYKVFYVNLEGYEEQPQIRLSSRVIQAPYYNVRHNRLTEHQREQLTSFAKTYGNNFDYFHNASFNFTIEDLIPILKYKKKEFNFDVCMIDYGQILTSKRKFEGLRHEQAYIHRGLATMAGELDCAMVTVAQGNRETQEKNMNSSALIRGIDISECFEIIRASATVITLNRSLKDQEMDRVKILLDKQRDGRTNIIEICKTSFQKMCFYGHESEGLGYLTTKQYLEETNQDKI